MTEAVRMLTKPLCRGDILSAIARIASEQNPPKLNAKNKEVNKIAKNILFLIKKTK